MNDLVTAYLDRLGLDAEPPSLQALTRLHQAHVERIPYETFWIHLAQGWGIDPIESFKRAATTRRGGYCFQLNGGLHKLLTHLGYNVSINPANVHGTEGAELKKLENHVVIIAEGIPCESNPNGRWWVDVGLGDALHKQMPLMNATRHQGLMQFGMEEVGEDGVGDWHLTADPSCWIAGVSMADQPANMDDFLDRHHFNVHSPESGYAKVVTAQLLKPNGKTIMRGCVLTQTDGSIVTTHTSESLPEWLEVLSEEFALTFENVPDESLKELWVKVRRIHEEWLQSRDNQ
ncbi:arylamine N-acetyltransferase [Pectobacterium quasiaquaticum]|uniref:Arylamine N-acetyltransferase n=1 Tax=Pectobacterium quasiaquaticum TaxID=2774015 RepID=A0A9Q2ENF1_9GAMM|nr:MULTISPECIES: arylamine N-acetyltransferase [Pectobacterium]MBE5203355.1 arylamine N-acetyltransferase [Pectobacterium quasiaquaticum]MBE5211451.1 arylamine N-acetyltransferase [Pectobacterium quasiaquaticum]MBE5214554.1 arylamine N-acetyltransferase [Pectobacterium quasiaquaticum]MBE5222637.1 arylamine N-acetyltransferase [Pectobacterium quasiaquaticum]MBE5226674.1 arylamine N-acetyltransferase [Pectobacterium quasiaquaticum]